MKKTLLESIFLAALLILPPAEANSASDAAEESWTYMPAGAKSSYMGIHGGTMPISLLVSDDGGSLLTFVGRTGNDFLETLRKRRLQLPSFGNSTRTGSTSIPARTTLFAGNATTSMPVLVVPGDALASLEAGHELDPFGLSDEKVSIEGDVTRPAHFPHARSLRPFAMPDYFQPRRAPVTSKP